MTDMVTVRFRTPSNTVHDRSMRADLVDAVRVELEPQGYTVLVLPEKKRRAKPVDLPSHEEIEEMLLDVVNLGVKLNHFRGGLEKAWLRTKPEDQK